MSWSGTMNCNIINSTGGTIANVTFSHEWNDSANAPIFNPNQGFANGDSVELTINVGEGGSDLWSVQSLPVQCCQGNRHAAALRWNGYTKCMRFDAHAFPSNSRHPGRCVRRARRAGKQETEKSCPAGGCRSVADSRVGVTTDAASRDRAASRFRSSVAKEGA